VKEAIQVEDGKYGRRATIRSRWSEEMAGLLLAKDVVELELNDGKGWIGKDVSFLSELPQLLSFKIIDLRIQSVAPVHVLRALLTLEVITYCQTEIMFSAFPQLDDCAIEWRPGAASLFGCSTLRHLFVNRYDGVDVDQFAKLNNLESLAILNAPIRDLRGLRGLTRLKCLRLANLRQLTSLAGVEALANLEELEITACDAIGSIQEVAFLKQLRRLQLNNDGDIASLKPLEVLSGLESVLFYESTNILDGNLQPLTFQKNLSRVSFRNRRHYSHRREDFGMAYSR